MLTVWRGLNICNQDIFRSLYTVNILRPSLYVTKLYSYRIEVRCRDKAHILELQGGRDDAGHGGAGGDDPPGGPGHTCCGEGGQRAAGQAELLGVRPPGGLGPLAQRRQAGPGLPRQDQVGCVACWCLFRLTHPCLCSLVVVGGRASAGMYQCIVSNTWEEAQAAAQVTCLLTKYSVVPNWLQVQLGDIPPVLLSAFPQQTLRPGPAVSLQCCASGSPPPNIEWFIDSQPVRIINILVG